METEIPGTVTIAPEVLVTIVQLTALEVPGVYGMSADWTRDVNRFFRNAHVGEGVQVRVDGTQVAVDLYIIVDQDVNMLQLGRAVQAEVTRAIEELVGMDVRTVDVHIKDVHFAPEET
jgi:uncharacterized alkaline shock family protein YloU